MPAGDLKHVLAHTEDVWRQLRGARLFITGATGFYGKWLLESIVAANDVLGSKVSATLLSRDPARFARELPRLALRTEFKWLTGETKSFSYPAGHFDYIVHLATPSAAEVGAGDTALALSALQGTHRVLQFARHCGAKRFLLASSGAVYGRQPTDLSHIPEDYSGASDPCQRGSAYGEIKRMSELMCALTPDVECVIARGFAFVGPYLPLTDKFAIGSFIRDALSGGPILVQGDGQTVRSYLYAADLAIWLLALIVRGQDGCAYNVGSDQSITTAELAARIAELTPTPVSIVIAGDADRSSIISANRYVPDIHRARHELGLNVTIDLISALKRSMVWAAGTIESIPR